MSLFRKKRAIVLGCGPAGLFAVHALVEKGWDVRILSKKRRSEMFGAQYLHEPIPGLSEHSTLLAYSLRGTVDGYRSKVYGNGYQGNVSPEILTGQHFAWDIRDAYYRAWESYQHLIVNNQIDFQDVFTALNDADLVVSSLPASTICISRDTHTFSSREIWAIGDAPERGIFCPITMPENTVVCNGEDYPAWYRASNVFGYKTSEWATEKKPPIEGIARVNKPIKTNCDCWLGKKFFRVGRYGTWTKGELSHQAYYKVKEML